LIRNDENGWLDTTASVVWMALNDTVEILKELEANGVEMVELGIPFSDPPLV
jgi:tryptophan synthase alpha chain